MAQSAGRSEIRHGFIFKRTCSHNFGKITSMATTTRGNLLICDNLEKTVTLLDPQGDYLSYIKLDWSPFDVDISQSNGCIITAPSDRRVLHLDPDQLAILVVKTTTNRPEGGDDKISVSFIPGDKNEIYLCSEGKESFSVDNIYGFEATFPLSTSKIRGRRFNETWQGMYMMYAVTCKENTLFKVVFNQYQVLEQLPQPEKIDIPSIDGITDICIDDNNHVYLTGLYSHTVHRLTEDGSVLDIPLTQDNTQGLQSPTAITFNQNYTKLYLATEWGKKVMVFDVV